MSAEFEEPLLSCDLQIDRPGAFAHNELVLGGWAVSPQGASGVLVAIDERTLSASYGLDTPELAAKMPEMPGAERAGYLLRIDTSEWEPGPRSVRIAVYDEAGKRAEIVGEVAIRPFWPSSRSAEENRERIAAGKVVLWLDQPAILEGPHEVERPGEIHGWAHAEGGIEAVIVTVDGCHQHEALRPVTRPDLLGEYGPGVAFDAGFVSRLHGSECEPGRHSLSVVALGRNGEAVGAAGEIVCLPEQAVGEAARVTLREDLEKPRQRDSERDPERPGAEWEDRALLAEASAAESRAEARLVHEHQRSFARIWRELEAKARGFDGVQGELEQRTAELESARVEVEELEAARSELAQRTAELEQSRAEVGLRTAELHGAREEARALEGAQALLAQREAELGQHSAELHGAREEARALEGAEALLAQREAELENVRRSLSWRITRPLRFVRSVLRRALALLRGRSAS